MSASVWGEMQKLQHALTCRWSPARSGHTTPALPNSIMAQVGIWEKSALVLAGKRRRSRRGQFAGGPKASSDWRTSRAIFLWRSSSGSLVAAAAW